MNRNESADKMFRYNINENLSFHLADHFNIYIIEVLHKFLYSENLRTVNLYLKHQSLQKCIAHKY